jgi:hypothetical protein
MSPTQTSTRTTALALLLTTLNGCGLCGLHAVTASDPTKATDEPVVIAPNDAVLRWESFPRKKDESVFGPDMATRITSVRYDVKLWPPTGSNQWSDSPLLVTGLTKPEHRLARPIPGVTYHWAARATFNLDGRPRFTQWTSTWSPPPIWDEAGDHPVLRVKER